ncbi:MAG TPA: methyltransferase domain-containing protein [Thermomicrobiales bacterium]|nr:methyltransferase domain-containing protein [Thermomicrobiales bacterium]
MSTEIARPLWRSTGGYRHVTGFRERPWLGRSDAAELMDGDGFTAAELTANFRDIRRVNRWFGGISAILGALPELVPAGATTFSLLDIATGVADIPLAIQQWCAARGLAVEITATDIEPKMLALASAQIAGTSGIHLRQADARAMPFASHSFDVVTCSLALHHCDPADAVQVLREMDRICRRGFIVNDLRRSALAYGATWLASRLTTRNRLTRHDGPLSIQRAYTPTELRALLDEAGVADAEVRISPWFRMVAVKRANLD